MCAKWLVYISGYEAKRGNLPVGCLPLKIVPRRGRHRIDARSSYNPNNNINAIESAKRVMTPRLCLSRSLRPFSPPANPSRPPEKMFFRGRRTCVCGFVLVLAALLVNIAGGCGERMALFLASLPLADVVHVENSTNTHSALVNQRDTRKRGKKRHQHSDTAQKLIFP